MASTSPSSTKGLSPSRTSPASASPLTKPPASNIWPSLDGSSPPTSGTTSAARTIASGASPWWGRRFRLQTTKMNPMFDLHAYGDEIAAILALDGNGERLMPLAGGTCSSAEARRLLKASRLHPALLAGLYLYFSCWDEAHGVAQDLQTPEGSYCHSIGHRQGTGAGNPGDQFPP